MQRARRCGVVLTIVAVLMGVPAVEAAAAGRPCPSFTAARVRGTLSDPELAEVSGLAAGRVNPGVLWAHADSGAGAEAHALSAAGRRLATYGLRGATAEDWEDLAIGPGPETGRSYLYVGDIGDIGDNAGTRADVTIYRTPEQQTGAPVTLERVASLSVPSAPFTGSTVTAGDISPSGDEILLRTYFTAFVWRRPPTRSVAGALGGVACPVPLAAETQGEVIAYRRDGNAYLTTSEWASAGPRPLHEYSARWQPDGLVRLGSGPTVAAMATSPG